MDNDSDFSFGVVSGRRKEKFEKDSKIRIAITSDKKFILRAVVIDKNNKAKMFTHSVSDIESLLSSIKDVLEKNVSKLDFTIKTEKMRVTKEELEKRHYKLRASAYETTEIRKKAF